MHSELQVKSSYITNDNFLFYIKNFKSIIKYLYLANNYNKYYLVITNETEQDINDINNNLINNKTNPEFNRLNLFILCFSDKQIEWCKNNNLQSQKNTKNIDFKNNYKPTVINKVGWAFEKHTLFLDYYKDEKIQIIHIEGLDHHWNILPYLNDKIYTLVTWPCYFHISSFKTALNALFTLNKNYNKKNICWLSPDLDGILWSYEFGFTAILCNQNCFLDYNKFVIKEDDKIYDMVMNCRPELWKRPFLAEKVDNLAYIKGATYGQQKLYDFSKLKSKYMNQNRIPMEEVLNIYNKSYCGGIFSEKEGACYSSSEYLLAGLPVISTISRGGRHTWYTPFNSVIVDASEEEVKKGVELCIYNIKNNIFNKEQIRNHHIKMTNEMRDNFNTHIQTIFDNNNININTTSYFEEKYFHKMKYNIKSVDCIPLLLNR